MAELTRRALVDGTRVYGVRWVIGGGRNRPGCKRDSASLETENDAVRFKLDVEDAGHFWPKKWIKNEYGYAELVVETETTRRATFADVADKYFTRMRKRISTNKVKGYTVHRYERMYESHLRPTLGDLDFTQIESEDIEEWIVTQAEAGCAAKSIRNRHGLLYSIMEHGQLRDKLRPDNPCQASAKELPESTDGKKRQVKFFLPEEWQTFRPHLQADVHLLCDVMLATGMRCGEAFALQVGDVRINAKNDVSILISRAWSKRGPYDKSAIREALGETTTWKISTPKSRVAHWVNIKGETAEELIDEIAGRDPGSYIFTTRTGTPWRYPDFHYDRWAPARRDAGLERINPTPHMLRHSFVVWALESGEDIYRVSSAVGHASIQVTQQVYSGHIDPTRNSVADAMSRRMDGMHSAPFIIQEDGDGEAMAS